MKCGASVKIANRVSLSPIITKFSFVLGGIGGNFVGGKSQRISEKIMEKKNSW
jgi:hypothetical protein